MANSGRFEMRLPYSLNVAVDKVLDAIEKEHGISVSKASLCRLGLCKICVDFGVMEESQVEAFSKAVAKKGNTRRKRYEDS